MRVLGRSGLRVVSLSPCFRGGGGGIEVLLEQVQLNFSFRNKFIILLPYGLLVDFFFISHFYCTASLITDYKYTYVTINGL